MSKIIAVIRTSTDAQEVESQKKEVLEMILQDGYSPDDITVIGESGASAIKLDDKYLENLNKVYDEIDRGGVEAVYAWAIDRIGRNEEVLMQFKNRLIKSGVQLVIKNPSLKLLNPDGTVNSGVELAFTLFATLAKQEMEQKKARFKRSKERNLEQGKSIGGNACLGYDIDKNKFWVINEKEQELVRLIFSLFNSGKYSTTTLAKELNKRGYKTKYGADFTPVMVGNILKNKTYTGEKPDKRGRVRVTPRIISPEELEKAEKLLKENNSRQEKGFKNTYFGLKLIKCKQCGRNYQVLNGTYHCTGNVLSKREGSKHLSNCSCTDALAVNNLDGILWKLTTGFLLEEIEEGDKELQGELRASREVLIGKIEVLREKLSLYDKKIEEIVEKSDMELRSEDWISKRLANVNRIREGERKELIKLEEELARINNTLRNSSSFQRFFTGYNSISEVELNGDGRVMKDLVNRYISQITFEKTTYNDNPNYYQINIETHKGTYIIFYNGRDRYLSRCFERQPGGWIDLHFNFERITREEGIISTPGIKRFRELGKIINTLKPDIKTIEELWEKLEKDHEALFKACRTDNNQRIMQYLNGIKEELREA